MADRTINVGQELLNVPMGDMIRSMATAIAEAQWELDKSAMVVTELMSGQRLMRNLETGELVDFEGKVIEPLKDDQGQIQRDERGEPIYAADNGPRVVDSRVYFGYVYEQREDSEGNSITVRVPNRVSMLEVGFTPTFYQFVDTVIEVKMAIKMTSSENESTSDQQTSSSSSQASSSSHYGWGRWWRWHGGSSSSAKNVSASASSVDAKYSSSYSYSVEGSSYLRTKMVPVPPPAILQERVRQLIDSERQYLEDVAAGSIPAVQTATT